MLKEGLMFLFVLFVIATLTSSVKAFGSATTNNEIVLQTTTVNGKTIRLVHQNTVYSEETCWDLNFPGVGIYPMFRSNQRLYLTIDGTEYPGAATQNYLAFDNWEHCPRTVGFDTHNIEHFVQVQGDFYEENNQIKINVRNYGGECLAGTFNNCIQTNSLLQPYDIVDTLAVLKPVSGGGGGGAGGTDCVPGSGVCCRGDGTFKGTDSVCATGLY